MGLISPADQLSGKRPLLSIKLNNFLKGITSQYTFFSKGLRDKFKNAVCYAVQMGVIDQSVKPGPVSVHTIQGEKERGEKKRRKKCMRKRERDKKESGVLTMTKENKGTLIL